MSRDKPWVAAFRAARTPLGANVGGYALMGGIGMLAAALVVTIGPIAPLVIVVGVLGGAAAVFRPGLVFGAYLLIPFYKGAVQAYVPVDITVLLAVVNSLQLVAVVGAMRNRSPSLAGLALWFGLASLVMAGTVYAADSNLAMATSIRFLSLVTIPIVAAGIRVAASPAHVRDVLWTFFAIGVVVAIVGLLNLSAVDRLAVLGMDTIQVGVSALLFVLVTISFILPTAPAPIRVLAVLLMPAAVVVAVASGSRGPLLLMLALGGLALVHRLVSRKAINRRIIVALAWVLAIGLGVLLVAPAMLPTISTARFTVFADFVQGILAGNSHASAVDTSSATRLRLFGIALSMFGDHPLIGSGTSGFEALSPRYAGSAPADVYPHDSVLQFAAEYGIVGLVLFGGLILMALRRPLPRGSSWTTLRVAFVYLALNSLVSGNILEDRMTWGLLMLIILTQVATDEAATLRASTVLPHQGRMADARSARLSAPL